MWIPLKQSNESSDEKQIRNLNFWHFVLVIFIVAWVIGAYIYFDKKTAVNPPPVIVLDSANGVRMSNLFKSDSINTQLFPGGKSAEKYEVREKYMFGDVVIVKFFYVEAVVLEKSATSDQYSILYKDHNHTLQKITLPRAMLVFPADGVLNPASLLVD